MSARDAMLGAIRRGLHDCRPRLAALAASAAHDMPPFVLPPATDLVAQFVAELRGLEASPHCCPSDQAALDVLRALLVAERARAAIAWSEAAVGLAGLDRLLASLSVERLEGPDRRTPSPPLGMADAEVGITGVDVAVAESGTLVLAGGGGRGRLASLLAPVHIAVVHQRQLVRGLGEAIAGLRLAEGSTLLERRSTITCITGPSRTADIELTLTLGVHGPGRMHVIIRTDG